ncbi:hypothetical protein [Arenimonas sp. MALMAid1274]|uniref:hypothetical protein n=1 Tax=Arenimonas sp. MALMAid1274 TaxID=3411630 RepID=UPI003B9F6F3F
MKKVLIALVLLVVAVVIVKESGKGNVPLLKTEPGITNVLAPTSPLYAQQQRFVDQFNADPQLRERFAGTFTSKGLFAEVQFALKRGAQSLDGPSLVKATKAMAAMIPRLPQHSCAKLMRPADDFDLPLSRDIDAALERLPPIHHYNLWDFYLRALKAEVTQAPIKPVNAAARQDALMLLGQKFPGRFGERIAAVVQNPVAASDEDACWAINTLTHNATQLSPDSAEALSRMIWAGDQ